MESLVTDTVLCSRDGLYFMCVLMSRKSGRQTFGLTPAQTSLVGKIFLNAKPGFFLLSVRDDYL